MRRMTIRVSVVVPTYKRPELLRRCLAALLTQDFDPKAYEIIIADDAACDETRCLVEEYALAGLEAEYAWWELQACYAGQRCSRRLWPHTRAAASVRARYLCSLSLPFLVEASMRLARCTRLMFGAGRVLPPGTAPELPACQQQRKRHPVKRQVVGQHVCDALTHGVEL